MHPENNLQPVKVSPLIRASRWTLLIAGIFYGAMKQKYLVEREVSIREEEEKQKKIKAAKLAEERQLASDRDIKMLGDIITGKSQ